MGANLERNACFKLFSLIYYRAKEEAHEELSKHYPMDKWTIAYGERLLKGMDNPMDRLGQQAAQTLPTGIAHTHEPLTTFPQG
ncbi:hypothetical protein WB91_08755 [bacteria symbiont BFo1 of Frankliniella occidentalis]|nr:hypothetical protein WB91_08755 [bacteria symbiont BFo1 of Frankliniella occidentalis]